MDNSPMSTDHHAATVDLAGLADPNPALGADLDDHGVAALDRRGDAPRALTVGYVDVARSSRERSA